MNRYLGIDQGGSGTKGIIINQNGEILEEYYKPITKKILSTDQVEYNPEEILDSVLDMINQAGEVTSIGLACQRSAVTAWDKNGNSLYSLLPWQDRRAQYIIDALSEEDKKTVNRLSTMPVISDYAAAKIAMLQKKFPEAYVGTLDSYLLYNLTGEFVSDHTMSARTLLYSIYDNAWSRELTEIFDVKIERLAAILPTVSNNLSYKDIPVNVLIGDKQAALYNVLCKNNILLNLGSISSILIPTAQEIKLEKGFISSILKADNSKIEYLLEALINSSGPVVEYLTKNLKLADDLKSLNKLLNTTDIVAFFAPRGTSTPDWIYNLPGVITDKRDYATALVENTGNFIIQNLLFLKEKEYIDSEVLVSGGLSELDYLLQYIADCSGLTLKVLSAEKASAYGVAKLSAGIEPSSLTFSKVYKCVNSKRASRYEKWSALKARVINQKVTQDEIFYE